jgi:hypothetical protein
VRVPVTTERDLERLRRLPPAERLKAAGAAIEEARASMGKLAQIRAEAIAELRREGWSLDAPSVLRAIDALARPDSFIWCSKTGFLTIQGTERRQSRVSRVRAEFVHPSGDKAAHDDPGDP